MKKSEKKLENKQTVLNPTVIKLGLVSFFADVASEMLYPVTPIFLTTILGASMASLGLIEGFAEAAASILKLFSGGWSDAIGKRKPFVVAGYLLSALSKPLIGISQNWFQIFGARSIDRVGKGIRSAPRDALIAESVSSSQRGEAFGWHRGMDTLGAAIGPLLTIFLLSAYSENLRTLYFWALIPGFISVVLVLTVKETKQETQKIPWENPLKSWNIFDLKFKKYIYAWGLFSLVNSSDVFLLMKVKSSGFSTSMVILFFCAYNLSYALSSPYLGRLSDRHGKNKMMMSGLLIFAGVYLGFSFAFEAWHFWTLFLTYGFYMAATDGVGKALAVDLLPPHSKATGMGFLAAITGVCTIVASVVAGLVWDHLGSSAAFLIGAVGALFATVLFMTNSFQNSSRL